MTSLAAFAVAALCVGIVDSQSCPSPSGSIRPSVASGYSLAVVATGLSDPRGLAFDTEGRLLVVEQGTGTISSHAITEEDGCTLATDSMVLIDEGLDLNHGIQVNGSTLYASNTNSVYSWTYDAAARSVDNQEELVNNMNNSDHATRTLQLSEYAPGMIVVSRGSASNLDQNSSTIEGGTAQVKAFNLANRTDVYDWDNDGLLLAWGVRNEVGIGEHPSTGGIWGVENSADQIMRDGVDISANNPAEELNFFGYLNGTPYDDQGGYFGYPWCLAAWNVSALPNNENLTVGAQFAFAEASTLGNENRTDEFCADTIRPRLVFQAHMAPLDIKFNNSGNDAWITFHGSWNRQEPIGYRLSVVRFENGQPVDAADSLTAEEIIVSNEDDSICPDDCFRPAAMAFDSQGRIFMSSDSTGEIYMITSNSSAPASASPSATPSSSAAVSTHTPWSAWSGLICAFALFLIVLT